MKKIIEIIQKNSEGCTENRADGLIMKLAAKEIHEYYMKFVEWLTGATLFFKIDGHEMTSNGIYKHYCDNVLNKDVK